MTDGHSYRTSNPVSICPMTWKPIDRERLDALVARDLAECSEDQRAFFHEAACPPVKWRQSPWGDAGGGFWAVAVWEDRVLWYNDIEDGFNISRYKVAGTIPDNEYWCNQNPLKWALAGLTYNPGP
jgi:hypothetical protein